ncbi:hypothetical protein R1sor_014641 [Riccia sorocarpa]|uniref:Uncharacterized protein n=1 Tax=Riccia sorocarpa TaxID=122646 RepID=A0ABD3HCZ1_9MARC
MIRYSVISSQDHWVQLHKDVQRNFEIKSRKWAKTESKKMAEKVEAEMLHFFDYPCNRGLNGAGRPEVSPGSPFSKAEEMASLELTQSLKALLALYFSRMDPSAPDLL